MKFKPTVKRLVALLLVVALMSLTFAACGGDSNSSTSSGNSSAAGTDSSTADSSSEGSDEQVSDGSVSYSQNGVGDTKYGPGEFMKYDEKVNITYGRSLDPNGSGYLAMEEIGEPYTDNRWTRYFEEAVNVGTEYTMIAPNTVDYAQKLLLAMTSGTLPDVFLVTDLSVLKQLAESGAIADLTTVYKDNVNTTLRDIIEYEGNEIYNPVTVDGKLMGIPVKMPSTNGYNHCWVRQDWLDELKLDRPKTMQDVHDIAKAFVENKADNIGLMLSKDYLAESKGIFWAYGGTTAGRNYWQKMDDGTVAFSEVQPEMKGGLGWLRDMYSEGLVNQEFSTQDIAKAFEYVANNQCGIFFGPHWYGFRLQTAEESMDTEANWVAVGLPTGDVEETKVYATNTFDGVYCVNANFEYPEAMIHVLNAYAEKLFGEENDFENFFACPGNSGCWDASPIHVLHPMVDLMPHQEMKAAMPDDVMENLVGQPRDYWNNIDQTKMGELTGSGANYWEYINTGLTAYQYMFGPIDSCFSFVDKTYPDIVEWNAYFGAPTPTWADRWSSMKELIDTTYLKIIQGQVELDSGFDQMVQEWNSIGGEQVTKEVNDIYATY